MLQLIGCKITRHDEIEGRASTVVCVCVCVCGETRNDWDWQNECILCQGEIRKWAACIVGCIGAGQPSVVGLLYGSLFSFLFFLFFLFLQMRRAFVVAGCWVHGMQFSWMYVVAWHGVS